MQIHKLTTGLSALTLASSACAAQQSADAYEISAANAVLETVIERDQSAGVMAAIIRDGELVWSGASGFADLEARLELTSDTRMRIGSVSKPFTAMIALRLAARGELDVNADIRDLVSELTEPNIGIITARNIAGHTSGIRHYDFSDIMDANNFFYYPSLTDALARTASDPLISQPGVSFNYSSLAYNVLGVASERATGRDFGTLLKDEISTPLNLENTMIDHPLNVIVRRTRFYTLFPDGVTRNTIWRDSSDFYPSGGILSTAEDIAQFAIAVFEGELISPELMPLVLTETTTNDGTGTGYTFGWQIVRDETGAVLHYEHGGETNGGYAYVRYTPSTRTAIGMIGNTNQAVGEPYFFEAARQDLPAIFQ
ncbi:MAG: serine hydrolase [Hyphobacterium sp.]|nr:MAG: serine hydrolase [Hyphobacterium sp.]